jgi:hypothetical protein
MLMAGLLRERKSPALAGVADERMGWSYLEGCVGPPDVSCHHLMAATMTIRRKNAPRAMMS